MYAGEVALPVGQTKAQLTKQEKEWRSQDDARILADSEVIRADAGRLKDAKEAAAKLATEDAKRAAAMIHVAKIRKSKTPIDRGEQHPVKLKSKPKPKNTHNVFNRI